MQFHLNGFRPGDPDILEPAEQYGASQDPDSLPEEVDVLIVGCGPAGLTLAAYLAAFPAIRTRIVDQKPGRCCSARPMASPAAPWRCSTPTASASAS
jgi:phenol 2-monooxygenase